MIRRYHRWLSVIFGIFLIWIATTGLLSHGAAIYRDSQAAPAAAPAAAPSVIPTAQAHEGAPMDSAAAPAAAPSVIPTAQAHEGAPMDSAAPASAAAPAFTCPADMTCRPKPAPDSAAAWVSFFHHLHAGEEFGAIGTALSILSGIALLFFALSGLYMYLELYRGRLARPARGGDTSRFFWK